MRATSVPAITFRNAAGAGETTAAAAPGTLAGPDPVPDRLNPLSGDRRMG